MKTGEIGCELMYYQFAGLPGGVGPESLDGCSVLLLSFLDLGRHRGIGGSSVWASIWAWLSRSRQKMLDILLRNGAKFRQHVL